MKSDDGNCGGEMVTLKTVVLDAEKCIGCITCMRRCPTEAIRIENGKAKILYDKCINCGECVRSCKGGASFFRASSGFSSSVFPA